MLIYIDFDKGSLILYIFRKISDTAADVSTRAIKSSQYMIDDIINPGFKNVCRNKISVQFSNANAAILPFLYNVYI